MARVSVFDYDTSPPTLQQLADAYQARGELGTISG